VRGHQVDDYLGRLAAALGEVLGPRLAGAYAVGSVALGAYRPGESDIDVLALTSESLPVADRRAVARACSHEALPCPGRKLELVVMPSEVARAAEVPVRWELNLNTGEGLDDHVGLDFAAEPGFWFVLDLALAHEHAVALVGPPGPEAIGAPDAARVGEAQAEAVAWYARNEPGREAFVAAARAWLWRETGRFAAKAEALRWAAGDSPLDTIEFPADEPERALRFWSGLLGEPLEPRAVDEGEGWQTRGGRPAVGVHARGRGPGDRFALPYFRVPDVGDALARVEALGGSVVHPGERWAICRDSEGSPFALAGHDCQR
jgi:predicted enzyme related to lactoylglutathione lyase